MDISDSCDSFIHNISEMDLFNKRTLHFAAVRSNKIRYQLIWEQQEIGLGDLRGLPAKMKLAIKFHYLYCMKSCLHYSLYIKNILLEFTLFIIVAGEENGFVMNPTTWKL